MNNKFKKKFIKLLESDIKEISDEDAMQTTLDKNSKPEDFDIKMDEISNSEDEALNASQDLINVVNNQNQIMVNKLQFWIKRIEDFVDFLNDTSGDSIQSNLTRSLPDTLFDKIKTAESKKIARTAVDLAALVETFKGYISTSNRPELRGV